MTYTREQLEQMTEDPAATSAHREAAAIYLGAIDRRILARGETYEEAYAAVDASAEKLGAAWLEGMAEGIRRANGGRA